ncbi:hypothetical protein BCR44DRAFT_1206511 [Catenaria anguillulae PL171]|uniref:Uncharacterized protein n=1 Tax=Catenaria anguillulae PL171 TaxID=765915 RepID=A0A1Y2HFE1_9FUNG|nr:hypothetical protein BCR44DRAFT_1206511 [Catenaria anguillulae PL171]
MSVSSLFSRFLPGSASASSTSTSRSHRQLAPNTASTKAEGNTLDAALRLDRFHRAWSTLVSARMPQRTRQRARPAPVVCCRPPRHIHSDARCRHVQVSSRPMPRLCSCSPFARDAH